MYKNQDNYVGRVPLEGVSHVYRVRKKLWPTPVENTIKRYLIGKTLHVCCGKSLLGDIRLDIDLKNEPDVQADAAFLPFKNNSFKTVLCDPPYTGLYIWNHRMLTELSRCAKGRIVFQHWFIPTTNDGRYRKNRDKFRLTKVFNWVPWSYFGRVNVISIFDNLKVIKNSKLSFCRK